MFKLRLAPCPRFGHHGMDDSRVVCDVCVGLYAFSLTLTLQSAVTDKWQSTHAQSATCLTARYRVFVLRLGSVSIWYYVL